MTTYLSKNELSYDIDFGIDDDCLEVAQLFDEASEGLVKYYHDDIFNISGDLPIPSTGITEFAKFMSTSETQRVYNGLVSWSEDRYLYKITNYMTNHFNDEKKAHIQVYIDNKVADAWFIEQFIVKAPFTRQGMGTQILNKVKIYAYNNSYSKVSIFCYDKNTGSKTFLESQGFSVNKTINVSSHPFFQSISVNNLHQMVCTL